MCALAWNTRVLLVFILVIMLLNSCTSQEQPVSKANVNPLTPTQSPLFRLQSTVTVVSENPPSVPTVRSQSTRVPLEEQIGQQPIFDDQLAANWSFEGSEMMLTDPQYSGYSKSGTVSLAVTPLRPEAFVQLSVKPDSPVRYRRDKVLGISFWLSGGKNYIAPEDLLVAAQGSNAFPYWVANDTSVKLEGRITKDAPLFSETRLYYLDINKPIPPETWVEVTLWLDDQQFDPDYTYFTGFHIRNDKDFRSTFYIDKVRLLIQK